LVTMRLTIMFGCYLRARYFTMALMGH